MFDNFRPEILWTISRFVLAKAVARLSKQGDRSSLLRESGHKKKYASPSENNFEFQNIPQTRWVNRGLQWAGTEWGKRVDGVGIEGNMKRFADKSQGAAPWLGLYSNFKTRFFDKLAYTLRRWQNPDGLVFIRLFASVGRWPRFYASVRDQLEWIDWKRPKNTLFRSFTWHGVFVHAYGEPTDSE